MRLGSLCLLALVAICLLARAPRGVEAGRVFARLGKTTESSCTSSSIFPAQMGVVVETPSPGGDA